MKSINNNTNKNSVMFNITNIYIYCMLSIYLLYVGSGGYTEILVNKYNLFIILSTIYLIIVSIVGVEICLINKINNKFKCKDIKFIKYTKFVLFLITIYLLLTILATVCSENLKISLHGGIQKEGLITIFIYCLSFLFIMYFSKPNKYMLYIFSLSITILCFISILQFLGYNVFGIFPKGLNYYDGDIKYHGFFISTLGNVGYMSSLLSMSIPIFSIFLIKLKSRNKFLLLVPIILSLYVLIKIKVLAGVVGLLIGSLICFPFVIIKERKFRKIYFIALVLILLLFLLLLYKCNFKNMEILSEIHYILNGDMEDDFGTGRIFIWKNVFKLIKEKPLLGGGPDTLLSRMNVCFNRYDNINGLYLKGMINSAHNCYLDIFVNQGVIAFIIYIVFIVYTFIQCYKYYEDTSVKSLGCGIFCYSVQAFFSVSSPIVTIYHWISLGLLYKLMIVKRSKE